VEPLLSDVRLGVYADLVYRRDDEGLSTDRAFILFVTALAGRVDELTLFGRLDPVPGRASYAIPRGVRFVALPHYRSVKDVPAVLRSLRAAVRTYRRELPALDAVWLFGPYPVSMVFALVALRRRKRVFLGVRQDFPAYIANRLPSRRWSWAVYVARAFEGMWRLLAHRAPAVVVGDELARHYPPGSLATGFSLIREGDVVGEAEALARPWSGEIVTVGRLDSEKNPLLLPEILALLRRDGADWRLVVVGQGPLERDVRERAHSLGVEDAIDLRGYVRNGPELWDTYRHASAFLHVSFTEGLPQVLWEAQAAGTPIVATDVGGVAAALGDGAAGLLVPPADADAAASALRRLKDDDALRARLVRAGLERAHAETLDAQLDRILRFFASSST
jgi:glycosyltransferase involved in cell wall biosynthesis